MWSGWGPATDDNIKPGLWAVRSGDRSLALGSYLEVTQGLRSHCTGTAWQGDAEKQLWLRGEGRLCLHLPDRQQQEERKHPPYCPWRKGKAVWASAMDRADKAKDKAWKIDKKSQNWNLPEEEFGFCQVVTSTLWHAGFQSLATRRGGREDSWD